MKLTWKKKQNKRTLGSLSQYPNLPFEKQTQEDHQNNQQGASAETEPEEEVGPNEPHKALASGESLDPHIQQLADDFQTQGNKLAEDGKYREALGKWEAALNLMPERAVLHEQKAQLLLEIGDAWNALKAATRATDLESSWAEAWITLGRAQLNYGEPDNAIESFDRALAIKPDSEEAKDDKQTALHLVKRRKQLHSSGLSATTNRYMVGDKTEHS
ncbi:hypothetical protein L1049_026659 [Liquidambar formosana]|uniref:Tetratricopeptide repeat protein 33 n=1 Tax=Liquidambar formosana TaxID=63359 RepID=A0AAP0NFY7_LIQFO